MSGTSVAAPVVTGAVALLLSTVPEDRRQLVTSAVMKQVLIEGADKEIVGQVAAEIRSLRPPEPYKGKGIRYADEKITIKETKKK